MKNYSDYLVFVDESGDHNLEAHDPKYPIFVLAFLVIKKSHYCDFLLPEFTKLKLKYFPTDNVIFHEREIRKKMGEFSFLQDPIRFNAFMDDLGFLIEKSDLNILAAAIRKDYDPSMGIINCSTVLTQNRTSSKAIFRPESQDMDDIHPYYLSTKLCLESLYDFLIEKNCSDQKLVVTFEARGKSEDKELVSNFLKIKDKNSFENFDLEIISKLSNSLGLQVVDLIARPIGINLLHPCQQNKAFEIIKSKIKSIDEIWAGWREEIWVEKKRGSI